LSRKKLHLSKKNRKKEIFVKKKGLIARIIRHPDESISKACFLSCRAEGRASGKPVTKTSGMLSEHG